MLDRPDHETNLLEYLQEHQAIRHGDAIALIWTVNDVFDIEGPDGPYDLTLEEARIILANVKHNHDASVGITWDTISDAVDDFVRERERKQARAAHDLTLARNGLLTYAQAERAAQERT